MLKWGLIYEAVRLYGIVGFVTVSPVFRRTCKPTGQAMAFSVIYTFRIPVKHINARQLAEIVLTFSWPIATPIQKHERR